ncbi:hypothetical protein DRB87_02025 [Pandoraea sp. XY-2]|nr:helix-turn-helix transcriptional regulator [Pandoraea sp. XY-2]QBC33682.1 hypothetical protein DRB87_02025 [Pandoraea sp. XY-2]
MDTNLFRFGRHLAGLRKKYNWAQDKLALESGLARSYLSGVERGKRNISLRNICILADTLGLPPHELLAFDSSNGMVADSGWRCPAIRIPRSTGPCRNCRTAIRRGCRSGPHAELASGPRRVARRNESGTIDRGTRRPRGARVPGAGQRRPRAPASLLGFSRSRGRRPPAR